MIEYTTQDWLNDELSRRIDAAEKEGLDAMSVDVVLRIAHQLAEEQDVEVHGITEEGHIIWYWES